MDNNHGTGGGGPLRDVAGPLHEVLRDARQEAGVSQEQLARKADCSTIYASMLERGYTPNQSDVLPRVIAALEALGVSFSPLAVRRRALRVTLNTLAHHTGFDKDTIIRLEREEERPASRAVMEQFAGALQTSVDRLWPNDLSPAGKLDR
jgi:transcriptional regulator with XRE-family HTH domain